MLTALLLINPFWMGWTSSMVTAQGPMNNASLLQAHADTKTARNPHHLHGTARLAEIPEFANCQQSKADLLHVTNA